MSAPVNAENVVQAVMEAFGKADDRPTPEQVETIMRPFGVIAYETERAIDRLLHRQGKSSVSFGINSWMEANFVVSGEGDHLERRI